MKKAIQYILLISIITSCASMDKRERHHEDMIIEEEIMPSNSLVDTSLTVDSLQKQQLLALEVRTVQKIEDLVDYLDIISNTKYDKALRENTLDLAFALFEPEAQVQYKHISVKKYLKKIYKGKGKIEFTKQMVKTTFTDYSEDKYTGYVMTEIDHTPIKIKVILKKNTKKIGDNQFQVWEIKLSDITKNGN